MTDFEVGVIRVVFYFQLSRNRCSARTMDEEVTRLSIRAEEPKIILHGSGNYP